MRAILALLWCMLIVGSTVAVSVAQPSCQSLLLMWQRQGNAATAAFLASEASMEDVRLLVLYLLGKDPTDQTPVRELLTLLQEHLKKAEKPKDTP